MSAKAAYAYDRDITGKGVTVAVIDSGINRTTPEFAGRISPDSTGFEQRVARCGSCAAETVPPYPIDDRDGHGTEVASIAAAARNGVGPQGVAPDATILALKIVGADLSGQTASSIGPVPEGAQPNALLIAPAIQYAVQKGAFVSVLAVNGSVGSGSPAAEQRAAMDAVRAADRLVVQSIANSTGEDSFAGQYAENLVGTDRANKDWFLFAVGVDQNGNPRSANGNAGVLADRMIAAAGNGVQVVNKDGSYITVTGNSFAAPAVAGAAALLKQYWPSLGGKAIARILLDSATDAGAPGVDQVFGVGILNVEKAMQAQASAASFVEAEMLSAQFSSLSLSTPFGGASAATKLNHALGQMTVFDAYDRNYAVARATHTIGAATTSRLLIGSLLNRSNATTQATLSEDRRFGIISSSSNGSSASIVRPAEVRFSPAPGQRLAVNANTVVTSGSNLAGSPLRGVGAPMVGSSGLWSTSEWSIGVSSGASRDRRSAITSLMVGLPFGFGVELANLTERGQVLGLRRTNASSPAVAITRLATASFNSEVVGVNISGRLTLCGTRAVTGWNDLRFDGRLIGSAFSLAASRQVAGGQVTIGLSSPLKLERARASIVAPETFDLITGAVTSQTFTTDLSPKVREFDIDVGWNFAISGSSSLRLGAAHAFNSGHTPGVSDNAGFVALVLR